ncbi:hypothetical protein [Methanotorris igneus]|uniref:HEAT domain containing protein n=1 Tax=Methanotorris igneus (strain DSM 5666 / JCM 11834 / Kol 5) TaxID=880724 RepID=F6BC28_METIK|nr:hypothetical protein [Methanotorris igneus]AEF96109.1 HEAT domain containing protein [Methanotorris igneus Kol 5]
MEYGLLNNINQLIQSNNYGERISSINLIVSKIGDKEVFKKVTPYLVKLLYDENMLVRVNALNSIKKIISEYPSIINSPEFEKLISHVYILGFTQCGIISKTLSSLINSIPKDTIKNIVTQLSYNLYSSDGLKRSLALFKISAISRYHPEYVKDILPEIMYLLTNDKLRLIQILVALMLEDFEGKETKMIFSKIPRLKYIPLDVDGFGLEVDVHPLIKIYFGSKHIGKEEIKKALEYLDDNDIIIEILSLSIIEHNVCALFELYNTKEIRDFVDKILNRLQCRYGIVRILSYLILSKIIAYKDIRNYLDEELINHCLSMLLENCEKFLMDRIFIKCYTLEAISTIYTNCENPKIKERIKEFCKKINIRDLACDHQNCYVYSILLLSSIGENVEDFITPDVYPDFVGGGKKLEKNHLLRYLGILN